MRDSIQFLRWNNGRALFRSTSFCIHNLRALIFLLSPYSSRSPTEPEKKAMWYFQWTHKKMSSLESEHFSQKNLSSRWFQFLFIVCYKAISSTLNGPDNDFSISKKYKLQFLFCCTEKKVGAGTKEKKESQVQLWRRFCNVIGDTIDPWYFP